MESNRVLRQNRKLTHCEIGRRFDENISEIQINTDREVKSDRK